MAFIKENKSQEILMNSASALRYLLDGKAITRKSFKKGEYIKAEFGKKNSKSHLYVFREGDMYPFTFSDDDIFATDFMLYNDITKGNKGVVKTKVKLDEKNGVTKKSTKANDVLDFI